MIQSYVSFFCLYNLEVVKFEQEIEYGLLRLSKVTEAQQTHPEKA